MRQFTPARVNAIHDRIVALVDELLNAQRDRRQLDVVDDFAYPLPVTIICELLAPREDESRFHAWATTSPTPSTRTLVRRPTRRRSRPDWPRDYMQKIIAERRANPRDDLLSGLAVGDDPTGQMDDANLVITMILLLIAGHETTVNLITNGTLTLLRYPAEMERLRDHPERAPIVVEEVLRFEPPVQFVTRFALADIEIGGGRSRAGRYPADPRRGNP